MREVELTCIRCPIGCALTAVLDKSGKEVAEVSGNGCPNGDQYARKEVVNPTRIVTSSVPVTGGCYQTVSCKTAADVPKSAIFSVMEDIKKVSVKAPVHIGDILIRNAASTGVDIVATREVDVKS